MCTQTVHSPKSAVTTCFAAHNGSRSDPARSNKGWMLQICTMETVCGKIFQHLQPNLHYLTLQIANRLTKLTRLLSWSFSTCLQTSLYFFCFLLRDSVLNSSPHSISSWRQEGPGTISKDHRLSVVGCGWTKRQTSTGIQRHVHWHLCNTMKWNQSNCFVRKVVSASFCGNIFFENWLPLATVQASSKHVSMETMHENDHCICLCELPQPKLAKKNRKRRDWRPWHFFQVLCPLSYVGYCWCDSAARFAMHRVFWSLSKYYSLRIS